MIRERQTSIRNRLGGKTAKRLFITPFEAWDSECAQTGQLWGWKGTAYISVLPHYSKEPPNLSRDYKNSHSRKTSLLTDVLIFTLYVQVFILTFFLKSVLKTQGLLSRPTVLVKILLLLTAINLETYSLFKGHSEDSHVLQLSDKSWHRGKKAGAGKRLKEFNGGLTLHWLADTLTFLVLSSSWVWALGQRNR